MSTQVFTVSEVSDIIGLPASTLRYYEKEGLIPPVERREAGRRRYSLVHLEALRFIECMKATGLPLTEIKEIIDLSQQGDSTIARRLEIMTAQRDAIREQIARLDYHLGTTRLPSRPVPAQCRMPCSRQVKSPNPTPCASTSADCQHATGGPGSVRLVNRSPKGAGHRQKVWVVTGNTSPPRVCSRPQGSPPSTSSSAPPALPQPTWQAPTAAATPPGAPMTAPSSKTSASLCRDSDGGDPWGRRLLPAVSYSTLNSCACGNLVLFTSLHDVGEFPVDEV